MEARRKPTRYETPSNGNGHKVIPDRDPTANVTALVLSESRRQDDLRVYSERLTEEQVKHATELADARTDCTKQISLINIAHVTLMGDERVKHAKEMTTAEANRVDAIRQVDVGQVAAALAAQTLAVQAVEARRITDADNLRAQTNTMKEEILKRFGAIEGTISEGRGRSSLADPAAEETRNTLNTVVRLMSESAGKKEGISATTAALGTGVVALLALIGIGSFVFAGHVAAPVVPQVIYIPAPPTTPTTPR